MIDITSNVREVVEKIKRFPGKWTGTTLELLKRVSDEVRDIMSRPGLPVTYPINWDTEKQKRFVIAKLRAEDNLPYTRTNTHANAWTSEFLGNGYVTANIGHQAVFLYGTPTGTFAGAVHVLPSGQSHIHEGRWRPVHKVVEAVLSRLPKQVLDLLRVVVNAD